MTSPLQLCGPCQTAIRTNRIADIKGPQNKPSNNSLSSGWECALCTTIADERRHDWKEPEKGILRYLQSKIHPLTDSTNGSGLHNRRRSTASDAPSPPISDIGDLLLVSSRTKRSECRFEAEDVDDLKYTPEPTYPVRVIPEKKIDPDLVRDWLSYCERNHEACVQRHSSTGSTLLLIDVQRRCLVSTNAARYFALSYVWGKTEQFLLKEANMEELQKENALRNHWSQIPPVLQDAITFVASLSEQYLWVDTLCIVQDSPKRQAWFSRMNEIYEGAVCTLAATEATDATCHLPGVGLNSRVLKSLGQVSALKIARRRPDLATACIKSTHERRAWTFQERTLSTRCLYFLNEQVHFQCQEAVWSEDRYEYFEQHFGTDYIHPSLQWIRGHSGLADLEKFQAYARLVTQYSKKHLSYSWDRLNAFSGFTSHFQEEWGWGFTSGVPLSCLDMALLWAPTVSSLERVGLDGNETYLPTWTWAGWLGGVSFRLAPDYQRKPAFCKFGITTGESVKIHQMPLDDDDEENTQWNARALLEDEQIANFGKEGDIYFAHLGQFRIANLLIFWTETILESSIPRKGTQILLQKFYGENTLNRHAYRLYGSEGPAGLLVHKAFALKKDCQYEYILISSDAYAKSSGQEFISALHDEVLDEETDGFNFDNIECKHYNKAPGQRMYIMLVKTTRAGYQERVAVGWIHAEAWREAKPERKRICLG